LYDCSDGKVVGSQHTTSTVGYRIEGADEIAWPSKSYELANWSTQLRSKVGSCAMVEGGLDGHTAEGIGRTHGGKLRTDTWQSEREKDSALWLVGAETPAYTAWLRAYGRQLLPDTVGLVERGDPARYRETAERPRGEARNGSDRKGGDAQGDCLRWPERTDARVGSYGRYRAVGMNGSFVWA
jgi:hypothetical protein